MALRLALIWALGLLAGAYTPVFAERMLPPAAPAARDLVVVDWQPKSARDRVDDLAVRSLQGLVNRRGARIWIGTEPRTGSPGWWLSQYQQMGLVDAKPAVIGRDDFLKRYRFYAKGVVVPPGNLGQGGYRVAVMKAAADDLIIGSRELAAKLGMEVVEDYSTRFSTYAESWRYALDELWPKLCGRAVFVDRDDLTNCTATVDYVVQQRIFLCAPHTAAPDEMGLFQETLSRLPGNCPVLGSVGGRGLYNEGDIVRAVSKSGNVFAGCSAVSNLTVHAGMKPVKLSQPMRDCPKLDRSRVYVAVEISDGDNANVFFTHIPRRRIWENRGQAPIGWTLGQVATELAPAIVAHYYATRSHLDEFISGVSGYAYMFPGDFGGALTSERREAVWRSFLKRTDDFLANADMHTTTTLHYQEAPGPVRLGVLARYAGLKNALGIINGYNAVYQDYGGRTCEFAEGLPVFNTVTDRTWSEPGDKTLAQEVIERTPKQRPAFMALFMIPFVLQPDHFGQVMDSLNQLEKRGYVLVLPSELAQLAREAHSGSSDH